ncbi:hypothetical protein [Bremerella alba]|uniref:Uncharacterized protein n=1 Tax=Bremerella alba TaxID=980252 RepID=A0A7V9A834_9BACT|nr:hypothetical protein [Bremerella alba]MBA2115883.1 hypothetical protein [Bremerella alba]
MQVWIWICIAAAVSGENLNFKHSDTWPHSAQPLKTEDQVRADIVIDAMMTTLGEIHSGDVQIIQEVTPRTDSYARKNRLWFDYDRRVERFDQQTGRLAQRIRVSDEVIFHLPRNTFTPAGRTHKSPGYITVDVRKDEVDVPGTIPIDVRIAGLGNFAHLRNHWTLEEFSEHRDAESSLFPATLSYIDETDPDPIFTDLVWIGPVSQGRLTKILLRLDRTRDFVPVINVLFVKNASGDFESISTNTADWISVNDTWVPVHWKATLASLEIVHDLQFHWRTVNRSINKKRFTLEDLDAPLGTSVINARRKDRVVIDRRIGL